MAACTALLTTLSTDVAHLVRQDLPRGDLRRLRRSGCGWSRALGLFALVVTIYVAQLVTRLFRYATRPDFRATVRQEAFLDHLDHQFDVTDELAALAELDGYQRLVLSRLPAGQPFTLKLRHASIMGLGDGGATAQLRFFGAAELVLPTGSGVVREDRVLAVQFNTTGVWRTLPQLIRERVLPDLAQHGDLTIVLSGECGTGRLDSRELDLHVDGVRRLRARVS